jgi:hypothetical protein
MSQWLQDLTTGWPMIAASGHRGRDFQGLMDAHEIVIHRVERDCGSGVVLNLFRERIGQPG